MIQAQGQNLIFLLSIPRSGSSLTTVMLQNHSKVFATQEMWFLMSLYDLQCKQPRPYGGTAIINQFFNGMLTQDIFDQASRSFAMEVYNGLLGASGAERVVDKSPRYYYCLEFIDRLFPRSHRIWLVRNPLDILASFKKVNQHVHDRFNLKEDLYAARFNIKMADIVVGLFRYADYFSSAHPMTYRLQYEQLVSHPEEQMQQLCNFLGLEYEQGLEKYGEFMHGSKSDMFFSMGVGDPFLSGHKEPHQQSVNNWKSFLDKQEVEMYCRAVGARIFHDMGYDEVLQEAQDWTGTVFEQEPDHELLRLRTQQLTEASGCTWLPDYRISAPLASSSATAAPDAQLQPDAPAAASAELLQLQVTLCALERRFEKSCEEMERYKKQYFQMIEKIDRVKSIVPFGHRLSRWASGYLAHDGRKP